MSKKIFLDANILVDFIDQKRTMHHWSKILIIECLEKNMRLYTSCDIITTVYYLGAKIDKKQALTQVSHLNTFCKIIDFSNSDVEHTCSLMQRDASFTDFEDTLQYILAKKSLCDLIISNDKNFISPDLPLMSSREFCETFS